MEISRFKLQSQAENPVKEDHLIMEKWNYILREEIGEKGKEGRHVFLADRILSEDSVEYGQQVHGVKTRKGKDCKSKRQRVVIKSTDCASVYLRSTLAELNCLQGLQHPGIPRILENRREGTSYHLVLPYIEGKSLKTILEEKKGVEPEEAFSLLRELGEILCYLHSLNPPILYRDLKPEHIRIDRNGQVHLLDFDGAMPMGKVGEQIGNPRFSAPEQFVSQAKVDERSDIYAFGKIAELLFFQFPPETLTTWERRKWKRFLKRCTQENKEKRYGNMKMVLRELKRLENPKTGKDSLGSSLP